MVERGIPARGKKAEQGTYIACSDILNKCYFWKMRRFSSRIGRLNQEHGRYDTEKILAG